MKTDRHQVTYRKYTPSSVAERCLVNTYALIWQMSSSLGRVSRSVSVTKNEIGRWIYITKSTVLYRARILEAIVNEAIATLQTFLRSKWKHRSFADELNVLKPQHHLFQCTFTAPRPGTHSTTGSCLSGPMIRRELTLTRYQCHPAWSATPPDCEAPACYDCL